MSSASCGWLRGQSITVCTWSCWWCCYDDEHCWCITSASVNSCF